jgi:hypothetical protein
MMTIIADDQEFQMHRGLLCYHSEYFKKLLNGLFREGGSNKHTLADVNKDTFTMFYNWTYTGTVTNSTGTSDAGLTFYDIVNIYVFADYHMVQQLKNRASELFFLRMVKEWVVQLDITSKLYEVTTEMSLLRKLHVNICLDTYGFENFRADACYVPKDFYVDLVERCQELETVPGFAPGLKSGEDKWITKTKSCFCDKYHEHESRPASANAQ